MADDERLEGEPVVLEETVLPGGLALRAISYQDGSVGFFVSDDDDDTTGCACQDCAPHDRADAPDEWCAIEGADVCETSEDETCE